MNPNTAVVLVAIIGIIVPVLTLIVKLYQDRTIAAEARVARQAISDAAFAAALRAKAAAVAVETVRVDLLAESSRVHEGLGKIHGLVNGQLAAALERVDVLLALLIECAPGDPRVLAILRDVKGSRSAPE